MDIQFPYSQTGIVSEFTVDDKSVQINHPITVVLVEEGQFFELREELRDLSFFLPDASVNADSSRELVFQVCCLLDAEFKAFLGRVKEVGRLQQDISANLAAFQEQADLWIKIHTRDVLRELKGQIAEEVNQLRAEVEKASIQEAVSQYHALEDIIEKLETSVFKSRQFLDNSKADYETLQNRLKQLKDGLSDQERDYQEKRETLNNLFSEINNLARKKSQLELEKEEFELKGDEKIVAEIDQELAGIEQEREALQRRINQLNPTLARDKQAVEIKRKKYQDVKKDYEDLSRTYESTQEKLARESQELQKRWNKREALVEKNPLLEDFHKDDGELEALRPREIVREVMNKKERLQRRIDKKLAEINTALEAQNLTVLPGQEVPELTVPPAPSRLEDNLQNFKGEFKRLLAFLVGVEREVHRLEVCQGQFELSDFLPLPTMNISWQPEPGAREPSSLINLWIAYHATRHHPVTLVLAPVENETMQQGLTLVLEKTQQKQGESGVDAGKLVIFHPKSSSWAVPESPLIQVEEL